MPGSSSHTPSSGGGGRSGALADGIRLDMNRAPQRMEFGPHHPAVRGALALKLELDGERILEAEIEIGFGHRGVEAKAEALAWHRAIPYIDRLQSQSAMMAATAYVLAVEKLLGLEPPLRAAWLRTLGCELGRMADHLARLASLARVLGAEAPAAWALGARARIGALLEALTGSQAGQQYVRIGGVAGPLPPDWVAHLRGVGPAVLAALDDFDAVLGQNRIFVDRLRGRGVLNAQACLGYGISGPLLRAAGVAADLRRDEPYLVYDELAFDLPVGLVGDNLDRYRVCLEELRQSLALVNQCATRLQALGTGDHRLKDPALGSMREWSGDESLEERIRWGRAHVAGPSVPRGEAGARVESSNGELGFYLVSDGSATPRRVRCRAPSFFNAQVLAQILRGQTLGDVGPTLALANIEGAECDR
ncbi:MAG: NADH-quinone oxidoreductase subunit D [Myxococcota bacterium]|nr:NADH-quinone oxidoreductase subunit D [Myxococcota bacterium]